MTELKVVTYFLGKIFSAIISLIIIPLFISWFGQEKYGEYILIYTTFLIFLSGSIGWINQSMIKFHSDYKEDRNSFYHKVHELTLQVSFITLIPLLVFIYFSTSASLLLLAIIGLGFLFACKYTSLLIENQAQLNSVKFSVAEIIRLSVFFGSVYFLNIASLFDELETIFLGLLLSYFIAFFFLNKRIILKDLYPKIRLEKTLIKKFIAFGLPLSLWMMLSPGTNGIDRYIINYSLGAIALAQYTAVYDVVFKIFTQLANPINSVYQPLLMKIYSDGDKTLFNKTLKKGLFYLVLICFPVFILVYLFQDFILINYLGFSDLEIVNKLKQIIIPLMISSLTWQIAIIYQKQLEAKGKTLLMTIILLIVICLFSVLTVFLIPYYGIIIMAYISVSSSITYLMLIILANKYESK